MNVHFLKKQLLLLFAEPSLEMVSVEEQLLGEMGIKGWGMPHYEVRKKEQFSQYWSIKMAMPHIDFQACYNCTNCV